MKNVTLPKRRGWSAASGPKDPFSVFGHSMLTVNHELIMKSRELTDFMNRKTLYPIFWRKYDCVSGVRAHPQVYKRVISVA